MLFDPNRGRLPPPNLDDRTWSDLVSDVVALIPQYAPQWTNQGPADVGMTLVEMFAWLVEGLTYRLNQVPDKNYLAFLNLLGITRVPPEPARSFLTFAAAGGAPVVLPKGSQAQTAATETQAAVVFETDADLTVLPVNLEAAALINKSGTSKYANVSGYYTTYPAPGATITVAPSQAVQLCLGFDNPTAAAVNLQVRLFQPLPQQTPSEATVSWLYSTTGTAPSGWPALTVPGSADGTAGLTQDGQVQLTVPATWASQAPTAWGVPAASAADVVTSAYYWIGLRVSNQSATAPLTLGVSSVLFNAVSSYTALTIPAPETLGTGNGTPFQVFPLASGPLFATPGSVTPYAHLVVQVNGVTWTQAGDLPAGPGPYYRVDPVQAQVMFGNYDPLSNTGHGTVPQTSDVIVATTYRYVATGAAGNVGADMVATLRTPVAGVSSVTNLFSAYGGSDAEPVAETMRRAPQLLRNRDRAVTADDYQTLALQASSGIASAGCLPPTDAYGSGAYGATAYGQLDRSAGNVAVIVVPALGPGVTATPAPTAELLLAVAAYLDSRRDVTASLNVTGPRYLPVNVIISASPWQSAQSSGLLSTPADLQVYIENQISLYLHPVVGGLDGSGWQVGQNVYIADLYKAIMPPESMGFISQLAVQAGTPLYTGSRPPQFVPAPPAGSWVRLADYELVCPGQITFTLGTWAS
jgi:predicted phage baseplate assembly protein